MNHLILGILIGAALVIFCLRLMERSAGVTNEEIEGWLDWREEWARRRAAEKELRDMGAVEMEMPIAGENESCTCNGECEGGCSCAANEEGKMKFYIASKLENAARVQELAGVLKSWGWQHTYDWTTHGCVLGDEKALQRVAKKELYGAAQADLVIVLLPGGRGTHTELGIALMSGCEIVLHSEDPGVFDPTSKETRSFYWLSGVERVCCPFEELSGWLKQRFGAVN